MIKIFFDRRWWWATLLVIVAVYVMIQLGLWQVRRLENRRAYNSQIILRMQAQPLALNEIPLNFENPIDLKYTPVVARGEYDFSQQIVLINQKWEGRLGARLFTPLVLEGEKQAVLVDRGWIPIEDAMPEIWGKYDEEKAAEVEGMIWLADVGVKSNVQDVGRAWFGVNIEGIQAQVSHPLLPFFIQESPSIDQADTPYRASPDVQLGDGPHQGYIIFWFLSAIIMSAGYVRMVWKQSRQGTLNQP